MGIQINSDSKSALELVQLYVDKFSFHRTAKISSSETEMLITTGIKDLPGNTHEVQLAAKFNDENGDLSLEISIVGIFKFDVELEDTEFKRQIIEKNTIAIMFPFLRSQTTLLTTQPDLTPFVIPILNINNFIEEQKKSRG